MTMIVIDKAEIRLTPQQLADALRQLSPNELDAVLRQLEQPTWEERLENLLVRVRQRAKQNPLSDQEIDAEVETARAELYANRS